VNKAAMLMGISAAAFHFVAIFRLPDYQRGYQDADLCDIPRYPLPAHPS
jgi:hypothetical protein